MTGESAAQRTSGGAGAKEGIPRAPRSRTVVWVAGVLGIALLAIAFRCWRLTTVPPGLYVDEVLTARNALAWRLDPHAGWLGSRPLLAPGWVETHNVYLAFASAVMALGGDDLVGVRLLSVLPSLAAVPLLYWLGSQVADRRTALLAAFLLACSHWAARSGRTGWDAVLLMALQLAALGCLAAALRRGRGAPAAVAGALLGLSLYTYVAARLALLYATIWLAWEGLVTREPAARRRALARLLLFLAATLAVVMPLVMTLGGGAAAVPLRAAQLSVWSLQGEGEPWATLGRNVLGHLLMFHARGGAYARDALPGFPMLDPVSGLLLLAGLVWVARQRDWRRRLLASWPLVMVLGGVLSHSGEGPPYPYRVLGLAPWACLVAALGGVTLWDAAGRRVAAPLRRGLALLALAAVVAANGWALFVAGPADPGTQRVYGTAATRLGLWLREHRAGRPVVVLPGALSPSPLPAGYRFAAANGTSFFRDLDTIAAVQLAAGLYRQHPERAVDPLRAAGDIDLLAAAPARLAGPTLLVVPPDWAAAAAPSPRVADRFAVPAGDDGRFVTVLLVRPEAGSPAP